MVSTFDLLELNIFCCISDIYAYTLTILTSCYLPYQLLPINTMYGGVTAGNDLLRKETQMYITYFPLLKDS